MPKYVTSRTITLPDSALRRRSFLLFGSAAIALTAVGKSWAVDGPNKLMGELVEDGQFEISKTETEWRNILTEDQFLILRKEKTEPRNTSPLLYEKRAGYLHCAGCDLPVYDNATKFDSGTGWPSYYQSLSNAVRVKEDKGFFSSRTEVHCRRCGGHLGHIFDDGPRPTGLRHCINGTALTFSPKAA